MPRKNSGKSLSIVVVLLAIAGLAIVSYMAWKARQIALPKGIASGNGRIEAKLVDSAAKEPLRVKEILVDEGNLVVPGQVLVRLDTATLDSELVEAKANIAAALERVATEKFNIVKQKSMVEHARIELERTRNLLRERAASEREEDARRTALDSATAALAAEEASLRSLEQQVEVAEANAATIQTRIDDATLKSPVRGRVLYRLAEVGEVLAAGGKALTLVNLEDVYMEIFLPAEEAASLKIGAEARITADHLPGRVAAGYVSFVSPEAQFTPKQVETRSEREKLMFRVKIQVPEELVSGYVERIKTGVRGMGYVKAIDSAVWPAWLQPNVAPPPKEADIAKAAQPGESAVPQPGR